MSWYIGKSTLLSSGGTEGFKNRSNVRLLSTSSDQKKSEPYKGEIYLSRYWNFLTHVRNFKPEFEFQTLLAWNHPVSTLELLPFDANLDLPWYWRFLEIPLRDSYLPPLLEFNRLLLSWGTKSITKRTRLPTFTLTQSPTTYIADLTLELRVGWKTLSR